MDPIELETRPEALYALATVALHADEEAHPAERRVLDEALTQVPPISSLDEARAKTLRDAVETAAAPSVELVEACCQALSDEDARQAFGLALDIVLADRDVDEVERAVLDAVRANLALSAAAAEELVDLLETKHSAPLADLDLPKPDEVVTLDVSTSEALLAFPVAAADADRGSGPLVLPPVRELVDLPTRDQEALLERLATGMERFGVDAFLAGCAQVLDADQRRQAFILAAQTVHLDREITARERGFLEDIRERLELSKPLARRILEAIGEMHRS